MSLAYGVTIWLLEAVQGYRVLTAVMPVDAIFLLFHEDFDPRVKTQHEFLWMGDDGVFRCHLLVGDVACRRSNVLSALVPASS